MSIDSPLFQFLLDETEPERRPMTVSELNAEVREGLERQFASVWVEGEIVNFNAAGSGHWYFNLNDGDAQIKCVCWKGTNYRVRFKPQDGITVRIRGRLTFWEQRGEVKLTVDSLEPSGEGALAAAYEQIRSKLEAEGLFADELKRAIPFLPRRVAVITSRSGAAIHDIVTVLTRRARSVSILLVPALVQGEGAADSIRNAVVGVNAYNRKLPSRDKIDVMIVGRGGGSAEDLWAFNDEMLARAIRASEIPIISAVGHEIDVTIADFVADLRAATPSAAAEIVAGREEDIINTFCAGETRLLDLIDRKLVEGRTATNNAATALETSFAFRLQRVRERHLAVSSRLTPATLRAKAVSVRNRLDILNQRQSTAINRLWSNRDQLVAKQMAKLDALSPLAVLTRGYSITETENGKIVRDASKTRAGDKLKIRLERGKLNAEVLSSED